MAVAFQAGTTTGPSDLNITVRDSGGNLIDPFKLIYAVYDATTGVEVLIGSPVNTPVRMGIGQFYAEVLIPADGNIGDWRIRWTIQETSISPVYQSVQPFNVIGNFAIASFTGNSVQDTLINSLRIILRDNNPDRNYRFRPPATEKFIQGQTQVFGFIWEDYELLEYLIMAVDDFNSRPPTTGLVLDDLESSMRRWRTAVILRAAAFACFAIAMNWIVDEFSAGGEEKVTVKVAEEECSLTLKELFDIVYEDEMGQVRKNTREAIEFLEQHDKESVLSEA
jgi:hypothetical protein